MNFSTKICAHTLAVAHVRGTLDEFVQWYKRSQRGPNALGMALGGGPINAGKKPSKRKKSNKSKPPVNEVIDMLAEENRVSVVTIQASPATERHNVVPPTQPPVLPTSFFPTEHNLPRHSSVVAPQQMFLPASMEMHQMQNTLAQRFQPQPVSVNVAKPNNFFGLKWVAGTTVSRCYGCNGVIKNPPESIPDDLIVVYRDIRQFRDRNTGQLRVTAEPQNVHFHLRASCIKTKYPSFSGSSALVVPHEFRQHLKYEHIERLNEQFGWLP